MRTLYDQKIASLSRREALDVAWKLGACAVLAPLTARHAWAKPAFSSYPFSLGVASGDPSPSGVVLWTRLAPEPDTGGGMPMQAVKVDWQIAHDEGMRRIVRQGSEMAYPELGHSVHAEVEGLAPGRDYWYRFMVGSESSPTGRTRTAPAAGDEVDHLRIGVCGCNHYEQGYFTAYRHMADAHFDAIFHTGDYIYEYRPTAGEEHKVRHHRGQETFTLADYRDRYAQYKSDPDLQAAHASAPFIVTWDDHEVDNDWAALANEYDAPPAVFLLRRAAAFQAYYEAMPLRRQSFPTASHLQLYRQIRFGRLLTADVLDTRQYRSRQVCRRDSRDDCRQLEDPQRTLLGTRQEHWLNRQLAQDAADWSVLAQQVPMFGRDATDQSRGNAHVMDKWSGYPAARENLMASIESNLPRDVVILSGDVHSHWAADIPRHMSQPDGPSVAVEFTTTSISSGGDGSDQADYWDAMKDEHPHVTYHSNRRGYLACEVTPRHWQTDHMTLTGVQTRDGVLARGARIVVERGSPVAQTV